MAIVFDGPVSPDALTTTIRQLPVPRSNALTELFGTFTRDDNRVEISELTRTNRVARFRAFDARLHTSERDVLSDKTVRMIPLSTSSPAIGEYERLQIEFARNRGGDRQAQINAIYNDAANGAAEIRNRAEMALGDVLADGKFTLSNEGGLSIEADFGPPGTHVVTAAAAWSTIATTALTDLYAWVAVYVATNGFAPATILTSQTVLTSVMTNTQIINAVYGSAAGRTRARLVDVNDFLLGEGLPTFRAPYDASFDVDGVTTRVIPVDKLIMLPPNPSDLAGFAYGVSATALQLVNSSESLMDFSDAPGIVGVVDKDGPPYREQVFVDAVGLPVLKAPKLLFVADVAP